MDTPMRNLTVTFCLALTFSVMARAAEEGGDELDVTPEGAVRRFMAAMAGGDGDAIELAILPHPEAAILFASEKRPQVDPKAFDAMPLQRLKQGDKVKLPGGKTLVLDETHVNDKRAQITSLGAPLPYIVVKVDSEWLVNADPVISARRAAARRTKPASPQRYRWTNDEESLKRLDPEVTIGDYSLRPPAGFEFSERIRNARNWTGKANTEDFGSRLNVIEFKRSAPNEPPSPEVTLASTLERFSKGFSEWRTSPVEMGEIGGVKFARADWAGLTAAADPKQSGTEKVHGFLYVTEDDARILTILHSSVEPHYRNSFQACESAALTWRKAEPE